MCWTNGPPIEPKHRKGDLRMKNARYMMGIALAAFILFSSTSAHAICRNLGPGDKYYPGYSRCCDGQGGSFWTSRSGTRKWWRGSCRYWGIRAQYRLIRRVCRELVPGDPYYRTWKSCCDTGRGGSWWVRRWGGGARKHYNRTCRSYGIK